MKRVPKVNDYIVFTPEIIRLCRDREMGRYNTTMMRFIEENGGKPIRVLEAKKCVDDEKVEVGLEGLYDGYCWIYKYDDFKIVDSVFDRLKKKLGYKK